VTRFVRAARCDAAASMEAGRMVNEKLEAFIEGSGAAGLRSQQVNHWTSLSPHL